MSSCAASCCICFPKASSAFATLVSLPTAGAPPSCRFAFNYSEQYSHRTPNQKPLLPRNRAHFGSVPNAAAAWWSSRDSPLPRSNSVLHPLSPQSPHETTFPSSLTWCPSPPAGVVRPACPQTSCPFPTSTQNPVPTTRKLSQTNPRLALARSSSCSPSFSPNPNMIE